MKFQGLLLTLAHRHNIALLLVTHDIDEALYLSGRVLVTGNRPSRVRHLIDLPLPLGTGLFSAPHQRIEAVEGPGLG